jgi:hypothetical protein
MVLLQVVYISKFVLSEIRNAVSLVVFFPPIHKDFYMGRWIYIYIRTKDLPVETQMGRFVLNGGLIDQIGIVVTKISTCLYQRV